MGLLDALLGQVLGGMAQQGRGGGLPGLDTSRMGGGLEGMPGMGGGLGGMPGMGSGMGGAGLAAIIAIALQLLQRNGGLEGILGRMQQTGHGREAESWVGPGQNEALTPDVLEQIFGRDQIDRTAQQMGVDPQDARGGLASMFPEIVNQMTPQGRVESGSDDLVARALEELQQGRPAR
jgi:uncharacterized protein YidB (DUF937 family)